MMNWYWQGSAPALVAALALVAAVGPQAAAQMAAPLQLSPLFTDGVVLQRGAPLPVWGTAAPGATVTVSLRGTSRAATADGTGSWRATLPAQAAGGPYDLAVASGGATTTLHDVYVGDVWVASGQSNMEFALRQATNGAAAAAAAHDSALRHFYLPHAFSPTPQKELKGGPWNPADPQHAPDFTAVGYFFGRDLRAAEKVPIGIIHTSWGGANIETWLSAAGQGLAPGAVDSLLAADRKYAAMIQDSLRARIGSLPTVDDGLVAGKALWADPALDDASWATLRVPGMWENAGYPGLDGVAWYRTTFELSAAEAAQPVTLALGPIDDDDITWVNGVEVGRTAGYNIPRNYTVPAGALHAGRNVVAVRVIDYGGGGGITGPGPIELRVGSDHRSLAGDWKFKVGMVQSGMMDGQRINKIPTYLYNAMVYPLLGYPIKGVIWYQGESNANSDRQAQAYAALMKGLVTSWRREWTGEPASLQPFPVLWVQLPNFGPVDTIPPATAG
ncbi:MAG TPA: sialate O-acetylesterase, partial [Longimicrobiales bacterium]